MNHERRLARASELVREAGTLALASFRNAALVVESKGVQDYVTEVDRAVEVLLVDRLHAEFPDDAFLGEEGGQRGASAGKSALWVIDPIDGTVNYTRGLPLWCISLAFVDSAGIAFGLIYNPVSDEFYCAVRGQGATCNGQPIRVSGVQAPESARIGLGFSYLRPPAVHVRGISRLLEANCEYARLGSGALGMAFVADGRFDGYWEPHINSWDVLAGICLVREAGGWVSDFLAGDGLFDGNPILACTPALKPFLQAQLTTLDAGA